MEGSTCWIVLLLPAMSQNILVKVENYRIWQEQFVFLEIFLVSCFVQDLLFFFHQVLNYGFKPKELVNKRIITSASELLDFSWWFRFRSGQTLPETLVLNQTIALNFTNTNNFTLVFQTKQNVRRQCGYIKLEGELCTCLDPSEDTELLHPTSICQGIYSLISLWGRDFIIRISIFYIGNKGQYEC